MALRWELQQEVKDCIACGAASTVVEDRETRLVSETANVMRFGVRLLSAGSRPLYHILSTRCLSSIDPSLGR